MSETQTTQTTTQAPVQAATATPATLEKTLYNTLVKISKPYAEGHVLTAIEAEALNTARAEAVVNKVRAKVKEMAEANKPIDEIQKAVTEGDNTYDFATARASGGGNSQEKALNVIKNKLARIKLREVLKSQNIKYEDYRKENPDKFEANLKKLTENEAIINLATEQLAKEQEEASKLADIVI